MNSLSGWPGEPFTSSRPVGLAQPERPSEKEKEREANRNAPLPHPNDHGSLTFVILGKDTG